MPRTLIGRTVRRLRAERDLSQQALATRLGISASYLNLIEHDQRAVTASLLIKLAETLRVDLGELSGTQERQLQVGLREAFADPLLGSDTVPDPEIEAIVHGKHRDPFSFLGPHGELIRAWLPHAREALLLDCDDSITPMEQGPTGFFTVTLPEPSRDYRIRITLYSGDPLTPGVGATEDAQRLSLHLLE